MKPLFLSRRKLFLLNIVFWIVLAVLDLLQGYAYAIRNGEEIMWMDRLSYTFSYFFTYWILSFGVFRLFIHTSDLSLSKSIKLYVPVSFLYGVIHLSVTMLCSMVIMRVYYMFFALGENPLTTPFGEAFLLNIKNWYPLIINGWMMYWILLGILFALNFYSKYQDQYTHRLELESRLNQAQLQTLKMQLQPHFLFNALNTIAMMVRRKKSGEAVEMISGLSELLRSTLNREGEQLVPLRDELELLKKYLDIEAIRFQDKLTIEWKVEQNCINARVPSLILQPIVENAFKHGVSRSLDEALITITSQCDMAYLHLSVINTGPLLAEDWGQKIGEGIGLQNTQTRLEQLYGDKQRLTIENFEGKGVKVSIKIPLER